MIGIFKSLHNSNTEPVMSGKKTVESSLMLTVGVVDLS